jgi:sialate O-acetylesterase
MHVRSLSILFFAATCSLAAAPSRGDVVAASPFKDHMVLQRGSAAPVWGTARAGEKVTVTVAGQTQSAAAGSDGKWIVRLAPLQAGGPHELTIKGEGDAITLKDVLVGEVWLCSGQSNMDFTVARTPKYYFAGVANEEQEVAAANYPQIRMFTGQWTKAYEPQANVEGAWKVCTPANVKEFSAVGYFFARDLHKSLNVPVGIITETFGASCAESWISRDALAADPELKATYLDTFDVKVKDYTPDKRAEYTSKLQAWKDKQQASAATAPATRGSRPPRPPGNPDPVQDQHNPTVMYNGMIAPIIPYGIKGVLWYQGESIVNGDDGIKLYPKVQATLVKDWRGRWNTPELPFYICQLAAHGKGSSRLPQVRAAQATILDLPHTGMAVLIDVGDRTNVHPKRKQEVANRLARIALAKDYGQLIEFSGPMYDSMQVNGGAIRLKFTHANGGLIAKDSPAGELKWFAIAGNDGKFFPAIAKIDGDVVIVSSPDVREPKAVHYAWEPYPEGGNLYNDAGLPAAPFTTER